MNIKKQILILSIALLVVNIVLGLYFYNNPFVYLLNYHGIIPGLVVSVLISIVVNSLVIKKISGLGNLSIYRDGLVIAVLYSAFGKIVLIISPILIFTRVRRKQIINR